MSLTISSYLQGHRTAEGSWIPTNPFYNTVHHRYSATTCVQLYNIPILRNSSVNGFYAITHMYRSRVVHTLLRQNRDGSVDIMTESGEVSQHFANLYEVLNTILKQMGYIAFVAAVAVAESVSSFRTHDPTDFVIVVSEDPT